MKTFLLCLALIWMMSVSEIKEIEMATVIRNLPRQDQRTKPMATKKPPAWLGKLGRSAGGLGQAGGGLGQNYTPANPNWQEPLSNTGVTDRRILDDGASVMTMDNMLPGGTGASTPVPALPKPAWLPKIFQTRGPAYGGSYNPTNMQTTPGQVSVPQWMGGDAEVRNIEQIAEEVWNPPAPAVPTYSASQGHPGGGVPVWMLPPAPLEPAPAGGGFGSSYGGNWRRGGGGGGYGYGGGGYSAPAWLPNMGLNSWVFRG